MARSTNEQKDAKSPPSQSAGRNSFRLFRVEGSPYLQVRMMVGGKRRQFSTGETSERAAGAKARAILADIVSRGFKAAVTLHSRKEDAIEADPTVEKMIELYGKVSKTFDSPPNANTARVYANNFKMVAGLAGAKRMSHFTTEAIDQAKRKYLKSAEAREKAVASARRSLASIIRNCASMFSKQALAGYRAEGLTISNPFADSKLRGLKIESYSPLARETLDKIWRNAHLLRDGDPSAPVPEKIQATKKPVDFREPHPDAYAILFLELGLGLRRNEADKAEWPWCSQLPDGRRFLEVRATDIFTPKSKCSRIIPIADDVWEALQTIRGDEKRFIVPAVVLRRRNRNATSYRCASGHEALVQWLRKMGIDSPKPCHALRKEFGSYVATSFSLFHAQKLLGHSSPAVTANYYASLTNLPVLNPTGQLGEKLS